MASKIGGITVEPTIEDIIKDLTEEILDLNRKTDKMFDSLQNLREQRKQLSEQLTTIEAEIDSLTDDYYAFEKFKRDKMKEIEELKKTLAKITPDAVVVPA